MQPNNQSQIKPYEFSFEIDEYAENKGGRAERKM